MKSQFEIECERNGLDCEEEMTRVKAENEANRAAKAAHAKATPIAPPPMDAMLAELQGGTQKKKKPRRKTKYERDEEARLKAEVGGKVAAAAAPMAAVEPAATSGGHLDALLGKLTEKSDAASGANKLGFQLGFSKAGADVEEADQERGRRDDEDRVLIEASQPPIPFTTAHAFSTYPCACLPLYSLTSDPCESD